MPDSDENVNNLKKKVAEYLKISIKQIEPLQLLRYKYGEKYSYHNDYLSGENIPNQRVHTVLVYLNDLKKEDGGATSFFHHKLKIEPKKGTAVWFRNMTDYGKLETKSLHAGEPILKENTVKYAINIWTRKKIYKFYIINNNLTIVFVFFVCILI
jgi:prolyl 4-hydroxylase